MGIERSYMLDRLPPELVEEFIGYLELKDAFHVKETCRVLDKAVMRSLWRCVEVRVAERTRGRRIYEPKRCQCDKCETVDECPKSAEEDRRPPQFRIKGARLGIVVDRSVDVNKYALSQTRRRAFDLVQQLSIIITAEGDCGWIIDDIIGHFKLSSLKLLNLALITTKIRLLSKVQSIINNVEQLAITLFPLRGVHTNLFQLHRCLCNSRISEKLLSISLGNLSFGKDQIDPEYGVMDQLSLLRDMMSQQLAAIRNLYIDGISFNSLDLDNLALPNVFTVSQSQLQSLVLYNFHSNGTSPDALTLMFSNKRFEQLHFLQVCGVILRTIITLLNDDRLQLPALKHLNVSDRMLHSAITENPQGVDGLMNILKTKCPKLESILFIPFTNVSIAPKLINAQDNNVPSLAPHIHYISVNTIF